MSQFGPAVRQIREGRGITRKELAARCGLTAGTLARIERGQYLRWPAVCRVCDGLGVGWLGLFSVVAERER